MINFFLNLCLYYIITRCLFVGSIYCIAHMARGDASINKYMWIPVVGELLYGLIMYGSLVLTIDVRTKAVAEAIRTRLKMYYWT